jgi:hypothetical protein
MELLSRMDSSVCIVIRLWVGRPGFVSRQGQTGSGDYPYSYRMVKGPGREDQSPPSSVEVKKAWNYISTPPYV